MAIWVLSHGSYFAHCALVLLDGPSFPGSITSVLAFRISFIPWSLLAHDSFFAATCSVPRREKATKAMSTSCRIDFTGQQGGLCVSEPIRVSRVQPAPLSQHMSSTAWNSFCDQIDKALEPLDKIKHIARIATFVFIAGFLCFMIIPFVSFATSDPWSGSSTGPTFLLFLIGPLILMGGMVATQCFAASRGRAAMREVEAVCEDISKQYSALSFHVRFEYFVYRRYGGYNSYGNNHTTYHHGGTSTHTTNFIEVNIADVEARGDMGIASAPPLVTASVVGGAERTAERLAELDNIRGMLSDEEYDRKRKEILDSL